jgi:ribosomal protein S18 acetylase RimI-like enzyme
VPKVNVITDINTTQQIADYLATNLKQFNELHIGPYERKPYVIYIENDDAVIIGGLKGDILENVCSVHTVWVHENYRHKGLGSRLFKQLEDFAKMHRCEFIQLDTAEFQAKSFYEKIGFSEVAQLLHNFKSYTTYIMRKYI